MCPWYGRVELRAGASQPSRIVAETTHLHKCRCGVGAAFPFAWAGRYKRLPVSNIVHSRGKLNDCFGDSWDMNGAHHGSQFDFYLEPTILEVSKNFP
jgi:hypothetical protein